MVPRLMDVIHDGIVNDLERKKFLQLYIGQVLKAKNEGISVKGYFVWSFTDNFEWAEGFEQSFGIVNIDFTTQKRTIKSSGLWYKKFLSGLPLKQETQKTVKNMEGNISERYICDIS